MHQTTQPKEAVLIQKRLNLICLMVLLGCILLLLSGCGGSSSSSQATPTPSPTPSPSPSPTPPTVQLGVAVAEKGLTDFLQWIPAEDGDGEQFPGSANIWDLYDDFSIDDGYDDQFDNALVLSVEVGGSGEDFPSVSYADLTWYTPEVTDLLDVAIIADSASGWALNDEYSAVIAPGLDNRLTQIVDLTGAAGTVIVSADTDYNDSQGSYLYIDDSYARIVIRELNGDELEVLDLTSASSFTITNYDRQVVVSIEFVSNGYGYLTIDDVSVTDDDTTEYIVDGDFESGNLDAWTASSAAVYQNVTTAAQTVNGLTVTRSFYTAPGSLWGRWVDVFTNDTAAGITATIGYYSDLGSDQYGIIYATPGTDGAALTTWDGDASDRDVGFAFGSGATVEYTSATDLATDDGDDDIYFTYEVTLAPGQSAAIANFIVMSGIDTGDTAADASATADVVDQALQGIVNDFWADVTYRHGMTQAQIDALINFPQSE